MIQVTLIKAPFGRKRMVATIGETILTHSFVFGKEHEGRAAAQAEKLERMLQAATEPETLLDRKIWANTTLGETPVTKVFRPRAG